MYSQKDEEKYILKYFKNHVGRFLDIGAYDGVTFSNTRALFELGWGGVCVEPAPTILPKLQKLYEGEDRIVILPVAVREYGGVECEEIFYESPNEAYSSFDKNHVVFWIGKGVEFKEIKVKVFNYDTLFDQVGTDFSFISIDVEGVSLRALLTLPFKMLPNLRCVCIEHDNKFTDCIQHFLIHGFNEFVCAGDNLIAMKKSEE